MGVILIYRIRLVLFMDWFKNNVTERKEVTMRERVDIGSYCKALYDELEDIRTRLCTLTEGVEALGSSGLMIRRHIDELVNAIDWKMEIFSKVCPVPGFEESHPSVIPTEEEFTPGYVGG